MRWKTMSIILGGLAVLLAACGSTPQPVASSRPQIATYVATARAEIGKVTVVSVSCKPGEQMVGGGFSSSDMFEYAANIDGSYPSSATTWTVTASAPSSYFDVEADVYCLAATVPVGVRIVRDAEATVGRAVCPQGTVLLSGGAQSAQAISVSHAESNGWMGASGRAGIQVYALCAVSHVLRGQVVTSHFNAQSSSHQYAPGSGSVVCPPGQVATGGGFEGQDLIVGSHATVPSFADWSVVAGGDGDVTISAVCWALQG